MRLTTREKYPHGAEGVSEDKLTGRYCRGVFEATACVNKLSEYENAEEDGLLVRLPCKAGDRIWILEKLINSGEWRLYGKETIITDIYLNAKRPPLFKATNLYGTLELSDFGDIAFTTEEAAWKRLKEIESKN